MDVQIFATRQERRAIWREVDSFNPKLSVFLWLPNNFIFLNIEKFHLSVDVSCAHKFAVRGDVHTVYVLLVLADLAGDLEVSRVYHLELELACNQF